MVAWSLLKAGVHRVTEDVMQSIIDEREADDEDRSSSERAHED